jgi:hypothetical protein
MQSQVSTNAALTPVFENGAARTAYSASAVVPASVDFIAATGGAGGITLTLTPVIYPTGSPGSPRMLLSVYYAIKSDAAAGVVIFIDPNGALFNGQSSYELTDQYQWAIFCWNGVGWDVLGN